VDFMESKNDYFQTSFTLESDEGASADHTHKFSGVIKQVAGRQGHVFGASYTIASLLGSVVCNIPTFTKSNTEINPIVQRYRWIRDQRGIGPLKVFTSDNLNGDGVVWRQHFDDQLQQGLVAPKSKDDPLLPFATQENAIKIKTKSAANTFARAAINLHFVNLGPDEKVITGIDAEWTVGEQGIIRLLIISLPGDDPVACFDFTAMDVHSEQDFPAELRTLLEQPKLIACGVQIGGDISRLRSYGVRIQTRIELQQLALAYEPQPEGTSLAALTRRYLQLNLDKSGQNADYTTTPLALNLWTYGATDGWVSRRLAETLLDLVKRKTTTGSIQEPPSIAMLSEGTEVKISIGGRFVAKAIVTFVGGVNGTQRTFGENFTVGKGRAIVKLVEVFQPTAKVPFPKANPAWPKRTTLGWIFSDDESPGHEIVVRTSNLTVLLGVDSQSRNDTQRGVPGDGTVTANDQSDQQTAQGVGVGGQTLPEKYQTVVGGSGNGGSSSFVPDHGGAFDNMLLESNDDCDDEPDGPVSRLHEDLFHQIKNLPIPKTCAVKVKIIQLLILASTHFVEEDYLRLAKVLMEKWGGERR